MEEEQLISLIRKYINAEDSADELETLTEYISRKEHAENISAALEKVLAQTGAKEGYDANRFDPLLKNILSADKINKPAQVKRLYPFRWAAAAAVVIMISAGGYFYFNKNEKQTAKTATQQQRFKNDVAPGSNKAVLTLADGTRIILDSANNGTLTQQGNIKIIKLDDGQLAYKGSGNEVLYNTVSTPKGGQFKITLSDGSTVMLNASSSLRFPASFSGKFRDVELAGEGYFEIAKNTAKPFHVKVNDMRVEVLGTHFNINAYEDEAAIKTTLLEGSVKVATVNAQESTLIKPGQQAQLKGKEIKVVPADIKEVIAWKEGRFYFDGSDIKTVMRQLSRWYDVEVKYENNIPDFFVAKIARDVPVSKLLQLLELTDLVHFKIEGNKITVMK